MIINRFICCRYKDNDPGGLNLQVRCKHGLKSTFNCKNIPMRTLLKNRSNFFKNKTKTSQDCYLIRFISAYYPQRHKKSKLPAASSKPRTHCCGFFLIGHNKKLVRVCKKMFMATFSIKSFRLRTICKNVFNGEVPTERRGGDHKLKKFFNKRNSVKEFIGKLQAKESHYARNKTKRIYLDCTLNIKALHNAYNDSVASDLKTSLGLFRKIFNTKFNIGFRAPATDQCSACTLLMNKIKICTDNRKKQELITEKRIHTLRKNAFYDLTKENRPDIFSICFDLQQVQPLPRTPIQDAFYSRQVSLYNLCIVDMKAKNPVFFCWTEIQSGRGAIEVGSALLQYLLEQDFTKKNIVRLFCDGCGGQNKNSHIIHTMLFWMVNHSPTSIQEIQITYPVRGHSFLPADRVFGRLEREIRKYPVITSKEDYFMHFSKFGEVRILGEEWRLYDIKQLCNYYKKITDMRNLKRVIIQKESKSTRYRTKTEHLLKVYKTYKFNDLSQRGVSLLKQKHNHPKLLNQYPLGRALTQAKKKDVDNLLIKQFGEDWKTLEELQWYTEILSNENILPESDDGDVSDSEACDCIEPDTDTLRI